MTVTNPISSEVAQSSGSGNTAWSPNALKVLCHRYLRRDEDGNCIESPEDLFLRVAAHIAAAERCYGKSDKEVEGICDRFYRIMTSGRFLPNSPTLMNGGRSNGILSACFVLPVEDSIDGIFSAIRNTALIQKAGGGTGFDFSSLRPKGDHVSSSGGRTSGPLAFLKVFSEATNAIQQGAFRRGANMAVMRIDHPDILDFINVKRDLGLLTNFNLSVAVTDEFIRAVGSNPERPLQVRNPRNGETWNLPREDGCWTVGQVFDLIVQRAQESGEPGIVFIDRVNEFNPTPHVGAIAATNPCGEQPLLPYESCNLGSINLHKFVRREADRTWFDFQALAEVVSLTVRFLDNVIDANSYPIPELEAAAKANRKIGLGVMGFADALFAQGIPYDSAEAVELGTRIMRVVNDESHRTSQELAKERSVFPNWEGSMWHAMGLRMRNACTTTVAPTGSISIIAGCSGGIEPLFGLVFRRNVLEGKQLLEVNTEFERVAKERGFWSPELMETLAVTGSIREIPDIPDDVKQVFVTSHDVAPEWHVRMQAAFQAHCDAGVSKTVNLPHESTPDDVRGVYLKAYELGCKGVTVYRDGCRASQPMSRQKADVQGRKATVTPMVLPDIMPAVRVRQLTPFGNMHIKIVVDPKSGADREVFAQLGKGGDLANADLEAICRLISLYLRVNGSLEAVIDQLQGIGSTLTIPTRDGRIQSLADGLARGLQKYRSADAGGRLQLRLNGRARQETNTRLAIRSNRSTNGNGANSFRLKCACGAELVFAEGCVKCLACGFSQC